MDLPIPSANRGLLRIITRTALRKHLKGSLGHFTQRELPQACQQNKVRCSAQRSAPSLRSLSMNVLRARSAGVCPVFVQHIPECYISSVGLTSRASTISRVFSLLLTTAWCHGRRADSSRSPLLCPVPSAHYWKSKRWEDFNSSASLRHHRESRDL
jgi:hypothetical protein